MVAWHACRHISARGSLQYLPKSEAADHRVIYISYLEAGQLKVLQLHQLRQRHQQYLRHTWHVTIRAHTIHMQTQQQASRTDFHRERAELSLSY